MSNKTFTADGKKMPGWYSWRHETADANVAAKERYQETRGKAARKRRADERKAAGSRTPEERLLRAIFGIAPDEVIR